METTEKPSAGPPGYGAGEMPPAGEAPTAAMPREERTISSAATARANGNGAGPGRAADQVRCPSCGRAMAADQRYCLECGARRGGPRVEFDQYLGERADASQPGLAPAVPPPPPVTPRYSTGGAEPDPRPVREVTPLMAAAGLMAFCLILIFGVLIGKQGGGGGNQAPIVATTGMPATAAPGTSSTTDVNVSFQADWPAGKEGFTIELATLTKEGTDPAMVESTKTDLAAQGASDVGVLDSDEFGSLPGGNYVFYSGQYANRGEAQGALASLKSSFPDAQVIEVAAEASTPAAARNNDAGGGNEALIQEEGEEPTEAPVEASKEALEDINSGSPEEFQENLKKLPTTIETEGKAPPKDNKPPGGGSGEATEIG